MPKYPIRRRIPTELTRQIGRIVTKHALLEWEIRQICYSLLYVGQKEGRVAVREPRNADYMTMIGDLLSIHGITVSLNLKEFGKSLRDFKFYRDALCHGVWIKDPTAKHPVLQFTSWIHDIPPGFPQGRKARIDPKGAQIRKETLRKLVTGIDLASERMRLLKVEVEQKLEASKKKHP